MLEFDYIVVGSGSSGAVVAHNLAIRGDVSVALLEAGPLRETSYELTRVPLNYMKLLITAIHDWKFSSLPIPRLKNRSVAFPRGKIVGGSSAVNALAYVVGHESDYEAWGKASSHFGWENAQSALRTIEFNASPSAGRGSIHGKMRVTKLKPDHLSQLFIDSCIRIGIPYNEDYNDGSLTGCSTFYLNTNEGKRFHVLDGYINPVRNRPNYSLIPDCSVERIIFEDGRAVAVQVDLDGLNQQIGIRNGLVLCGGSFGTPRLLEFSGVGNRDLLEQLQIEVVHHSPGVGEHLQDHVGVRVTQKIREGLGWNLILNNPVLNKVAQVYYRHTHAGPYAIASSKATAFFKGEDSQGGPNLQFHFMSYSTDQVGKGFHSYSGVTVSVCLLRPKSMGSTHISSNDRHAPLHIQPNFLSNPADLQDLESGLTTLLSLFVDTPLGQVTVNFGKTLRKFQDQNALRNYILENAFALYHPTSTCRMGEDEMSPVDANFRLKGIENVWVADASVMPAIPTGNSHCPAMIVGELASRAIITTEKL